MQSAGSGHSLCCYLKQRKGWTTDIFVTDYTKLEVGGKLFRQCCGCKGFNLNLVSEHLIC